MKDGPAVDDDDRQRERAQVERLKRGRGVGTRLGLQKSMWVTIACEKGLNTKGIAGVCATRQDDPALRMLNQSDPAENERPKDDLADVRLGAGHSPKSRSRNANNLCRLRGACADQDRATAQVVELSGELTCFVCDDQGVAAVPITLKDVDGALQNKEEIDIPVTDPIEIGSAIKAVLLSVRFDPVDHLRRQFRKRLCRSFIRSLDILPP